MGLLFLSLLCLSYRSFLLSAASAGEDLPLSVGIPTSWAKLNRGVRQAVDRFHPLLDDYAAIRTGTCSH